MKGSMIRDRSRTNLFSSLTNLVERATRRWSADPLAAFVVDLADPLGAALAEMVRRLGCGLWRSCGRRRRLKSLVVVGAAPLADIQTIASGLATADRGLASVGELRQTPGAASLEAALARAVSSRLMLVGRGTRRVSRLAIDSMVGWPESACHDAPDMAGR